VNITETPRSTCGVIGDWTSRGNGRTIVGPTEKSTSNRTEVETKIPLFVCSWSESTGIKQTPISVTEIAEHESYIKHFVSTCTTGT
jgi:hypothetical protein